MAESTPLGPLLEEHHEELVGERRTNAPSESTPTPVYFRILKIITVGLSAVTLGLLLVNHIIVRYAPFIGYYWNTLEASVALGQLALVSLILSIINLLVNFPALLNLIIDIVLARAIFSSVNRLLNAFPTEWCRDQYPNPYPEPNPKCKDWELAMKILIGVAAGLGTILGLLYISLLVLRAAALFRSNFWKRPIALNFPTGQISLEIRLKFLRQEGGTPENTVGRGAEATSSSRHGPLHL